MKTFQKTGYVQRFLGAICIVFVTAVGIADSDVRTTKSEFAVAYEQWMQQSAKPEVSLRSDGVIYTLPAYKKIVALGFSALPEIMSKLPDDPMLARAIFDITKKRLTREEGRATIMHADRVAYLKAWWKNVEQDTSTRFAEHHQKLKAAKKRANEVEAIEQRQKIRDIGRTALPHIFDRIASGDVELIPIASELLDGALPNNASPQECAAWWNENRGKWTLPLK